MTDRRARLALAAVVFAVMLAQVLIYPGVDVLAAEFGGDGVAAPTLFLAAEFAAFVAFAGPWGALSDAFDRRRPFVVVAAAGGALGYLALAALASLSDPPFAAALLLRAAQGAFTVGAFSLAMSALADLGGGNGRNMGAAGIAVGLGTATGAPLGGRLYEAGTTLPLSAAAALLGVAALLALAAPDRAPAGSERGIGALLAGLRDRRELAVPYAFGFVDRLTAGFFALVGTLYFREAFGLGPATTGLLLACFFAPFALLQYPFGVLSDRVGRVAPVTLGSVAYGVAVAGVALAPTVPLAGAAMAVVGVLGALMAPATLALTVDLAGDGERGVAVAGFNAAGSLGFLAGSLVGGAVAARFGFLAAFGVAGGLEVAVAAVTLPALLRLRVGGASVFARGEREDV